MQNIYQQAQETVQNNPQWASGQNRVIWQNGKASITVQEYGRDGGGLLGLQMLADGQQINVQCGHMDLKRGWVWTLTEFDYESWVARCKRVV